MIDFSLPNKTGHNFGLTKLLTNTFSRNKQKIKVFTRFCD